MVAKIHFDRNYEIRFDHFNTQVTDLLSEIGFDEEQLRDGKIVRKECIKNKVDFDSLKQVARTGEGEAPVKMSQSDQLHFCWRSNCLPK